MPRAFLRVAGVTLAQHQLGIALALECQRVICIAREFSRELVALQHEAERSGAQFHVVPRARSLAGLISAHDEVVVLTDGLLATPRDVVRLLGEGHAVLVQPVDAGLAAGFERIDLNHAAAGAMAIPGRLVERLGELPADYDVASALTRVALQAGVYTQDIGDALRETGHWQLIRDEAGAHAAEERWIRLHVGDTRVATPGSTIVRLAVTAFAPALLHAGTGGATVALAAAAALLLALAGGWLGFTGSALVFCALAWALRSAAALIDRIRHDSSDPSTGVVLRDRALDWALDLTIGAILFWNIPYSGVTGLFGRLFVPIMLLGLLRLLPRALDRRWNAWLDDRFLLALLLALAAAVGIAGEAARVFAILLLVGGIFLASPRTRLTSA